MNLLTSQENDNKLARDIIELFDREELLLKRGTRPESLEGSSSSPNNLTTRIEKTFSQFVSVAMRDPRF